MRTWLANWWLAFTTGFLFVPGLFLIGGIAIGLFGPEIDDLVRDSLPSFLKTTHTTARATLSALCSAMFTVTGVVFSTTCVALSITSTQLGPRLLRNFLGQQVTQVTIGVCLATSVCCLILLRRVDQLDGSFVVPHASILVASILGVTTLITVVYFLHRVTRAMQAQSVASDVADDLDASVRRLFPEQLGEPSEADHESDSWEGEWKRFDDAETTSADAIQDGYLQAIDDEALLRVAGETGSAIRVLNRPGDFIREGDPLVDLLPATELSDAHLKLIHGSFLTGEQRTTQQDVECAINELVEIAVRALSPGVNDPFTAIACIDRLSGALCRMARRKIPSGLRSGSDTEALIVVKPRTFSDALNTAFNQLRQHSRGDVAVTIRLLEAAGAIARRVQRVADHDALTRQIDMIIDSARAADIPEADLEDIERWHTEVSHTLSTKRDALKAPA